MLLRCKLECKYIYIALTDVHLYLLSQHLLHIHYAHVCLFFCHLPYRHYYYSACLIVPQIMPLRMSLVSGSSTRYIFAVCT